MEHRIGSVADVRRAGCVVVQVEGRPVGVIAAGDDFFAVHDRCPHMGAPLCSGSVSGTLLPAGPHELVYGQDGQVLRCPWHGWEFDLVSGRSLLEPRRVGLRTYRVTSADGEVVLHT